MDISEATIEKKYREHCGVPQCNNYKSDKISMFRLPKKVRESKDLLKRWSIALKMGKQMPSRFVICSEHFKEKDVYLSIHDPQKRRRLVENAFPCAKLPKSSINNLKRECDRGTRLANRLNRQSADLRTGEDCSVLDAVVDVDECN